MNRQEETIFDLVENLPVTSMPTVFRSSSLLKGISSESTPVVHFRNLGEAPYGNYIISFKNVNDLSKFHIEIRAIGNRKSSRFKYTLTYAIAIVGKSSWAEPNFRYYSTVKISHFEKEEHFESFTVLINWANKFLKSYLEERSKDAIQLT